MAVRLIPVILALLCALFAASLVLLAQGLSARRVEKRLQMARAVFELAQKSGGMVTAKEVAQALQLRRYDADVLLREMVDDRAFTMGIDDKTATVRFWYPELVQQARAQRSSSSDKPDRSSNGSTSGRGPSARPASTMS